MRMVCSADCGAEAENGIESVSDVVKWMWNRLRWLGHVLRKDDGDWVKKCMVYEVEGERGRGRWRTTWNQVVGRNVRKRGLRSLLVPFGGPGKHCMCTYIYNPESHSILCCTDHTSCLKNCLYIGTVHFLYSKGQWSTFRHNYKLNMV